MCRRSNRLKRQQKSSTFPKTYTPLGDHQIRVLRLSPDEFGSPLQGAFVVTDMDDAQVRQEYSAIS